MRGWIFVLEFTVTGSWPDEVERTSVSTERWRHVHDCPMDVAIAAVRRQFPKAEILSVTRADALSTVSAAVAEAVAAA